MVMVCMMIVIMVSIMIVIVVTMVMVVMRVMVVMVVTAAATTVTCRRWTTLPSGASSNAELDRRCLIRATDHRRNEETVRVLA